MGTQFLLLLLFTALALAVPEPKHHHKGGGYEDYGVEVHQPYIVQKPTIVHQPKVEYKKVYFRPPPPPPPPPVWIKKPVIHHVKEWQLVDVPKVTYKEVLVHPSPYYGYSKKGHGKFSKFFDKFKW